MTSATATPRAARPALPRDVRRRPRPDAPPSSAGYWLFVLYLILEFDRPPGLAALKLQMGIAVVLPLMWLAARNRPWSQVLSAQLALLAASAATVTFASNNYAAYFTTRTLFSSVAVGIAVSWIFADRDMMRRYYWVWLLVISWIAFFGITHGGRGPGGFLGDENDLALACVGAFPFAFYGFQLLPGMRKIVAGGLGVVLLMGVVTSLSRGGFVGLVAALVYCFAVSANRLRNLLVAVVASVVFFLAVPTSYVTEMSSMQNTESGTADTRRFLWATARAVWRAYPILGAGAGNFNYVAGDFTPKDEPKWSGPEYQERNWSGTTVHSSYFQILSELGTVGSAIYAFLIYSHFRSISQLRKRVRRRKDLSKQIKNEVELYGGALAAAMIGTLGAGAFLSAVYYPYVYLYSGAGVALVAWASRATAEPAEPVPSPKSGSVD